MTKDAPGQLKVAKAEEAKEKTVSVQPRLVAFSKRALLAATLSLVFATALVLGLILHRHGLSRSSSSSPNESTSLPRPHYVSPFIGPVLVGGKMVLLRSDYQDTVPNEAASERFTSTLVGPAQS